METLSLFDVCKEPLKIDKPIRLIELFAGIGSQAKALKRLGANFVHYRVCDFDKYAIASYNAIHGTDFEPSDITEITAYDLGISDTEQYCYIMTYSFPCQDLSLAGKGNGMAKGSGTRSGLLWEVERLLNECTELPQILLMENVTQVHGKRNKEHFDKWIKFLESKGYSNYWQDLNAKNFGIPQNRNRTFMVSVLGEYIYEFPQEFPLKLRLKDMLEDAVDEKFYIKNFDSITAVNQEYSMINGGTIGKMHDVSRRVYNDGAIAPTIHTCGGGNTEPKVLAGIGEKNFGKQYRQGNRIYDANAVAMALGASPVGNAGGHSYLYAIDEPFICASRGRNPENPSDRTAGIPTEQRLEPNFSGCSNTLTTVQKDNYVAEPQVLRAKRTEYGKNIRKQYEAGEIDEKIGNMREMKPRTDGVSNTITTVIKDNYVTEPCIGVIGNYSPSGHEASRIVDMNGLAPTVKENHGTVTAIAESQIIKAGQLESSFDQSGRVYDPEGIAPTIMSNSHGKTSGGYTSPKIISDRVQMVVELQVNETRNFRIRKLTPKECWRLMGFDDADFEKAAAVNSNTQLYKQAGNSIVVDVLYYIFKNMGGVLDDRKKNRRRT